MEGSTWHFYDKFTIKRLDGIKNLKLGEGSSQSSVNMQMKMRKSERGMRDTRGTRGTRSMSV